MLQPPTLRMPSSTATGGLSTGPSKQRKRMAFVPTKYRYLHVRTRKFITVDGDAHGLNLSLAPGRAAGKTQEFEKGAGAHVPASLRLSTPRI